MIIFLFGLLLLVLLLFSKQDNITNTYSTDVDSPDELGENSRGDRNGH